MNGFINWLEKFMKIIDIIENWFIVVLSAALIVAVGVVYRLPWFYYILAFVGLAIITVIAVKLFKRFSK